MANLELNVELNVDTEILRAQLDTANARIKRAEHALTSAGWTYREGAAAWKPPLGPSASPLLDRIAEMQATIDTLYAEWPGGLEEIASAMRTSAERQNHIAELERVHGVMVGALESWRSAENYSFDYRNTPEAQQEITDAWADAAAKRDAALAAARAPEGGV